MRLNHLIANIIIVCVTIFNSAIIGQEKVTVSANKLIFESFSKWTADTSCTQITKFNSPYANRGTVELVLICQALKLGGFNAELEIIVMPNYLRSLFEAQQGNVHLPAETVWEFDIDDSLFYKTDAIIQDGEFEKGIYTIPTNTELLKTRTIEKLRQFSAVIPKTWVLDWKLLEEMKLARLDNAPKKELLFKIVGKRRADFTLLEFSSEDDLSNEMEGVRLVPVPNIKVALKGSRHWAVSQKAPHSKLVYEALQKGVKILREKGTIKKAFLESGFFNAKTANWKRIF